MKFMKLLQSNRSEADKVQEQARDEVVATKERKDPPGMKVNAKDNLDTIDSAETKVSQAIQELFESRRTFQTRVEENTRIIQDKDTMIQEFAREKSFLETKTTSLTDEISKLQDEISQRKLQNEQVQSEFNAYKSQQGDKIQKLQDTLHERELNNQQLLLDFNQYRQKSEGRVQLLESQARDAQVKHHHLEQKYQEAIEEISRLDRVIKDFAAQASTLADASGAK